MWFCVVLDSLVQVLFPSARLDSISVAGMRVYRRVFVNVDLWTAVVARMHDVYPSRHEALRP